ncbi:MAG: hypothetical protein ACI8XM_000049 [Haloarculaceae archaeon]|jgi:hypothetical protein
MITLAASTVDVDESPSNSPQTPHTAKMQSPEPGSCRHPLSAQSIEELEDGQYARSCQCGVLLDAWSTQEGVAGGLEALAARRGTTVDRIATALGIDC